MEANNAGLFNNDGSVLLASLWAGMVLSSFLISLAFQAGVQKEWAKRGLLEFRGHRNVLAGAIWAAPSRGKGEAQMTLPGAMNVGVQFEDEEAKLNINAAGEFVILELLKVLKNQEGLRFSNDDRKIAKGICAYREKKSNGRYEFLEELLLAGEVKEEDFIRIAPYLTVYAPALGLPAVNINTVSGPVLRALLNCVPGDSWKKKDLAEKILESRASEDEDKACWTEEDLSPYALSLKLGLPPSPEWLALVNHILPYLKAGSRTFRVFIVSAGEGKKAVAVIRERKDGAEHEILDWQED